MPLVSIGLPVWNGEKYLEAALDAVLAQSFDDFEVLISDNSSTDRTAEIAQTFAARDPRIRFVRQKRNLGAAENFNYVFHHTTGQYFRWAAYDDLIAPDYLKECVAALEADDGQSVLVYPGTMRIDENGKELGVHDSVTRLGGITAAERLTNLLGPGDHMLSHLHMCFPVFGLIRRDKLAGTSLIANMPRSDNLLLVELACMGNFKRVDAPLFLRREHDGGSVISAETASTSEELERRLSAWFDPNKGKFFPATSTRLGWGYVRAALRTAMPAGQKMPAVLVTLGWLGRNFKIIGGEIKIVLREQIGYRIYRLRKMFSFGRQ